LAILLVATPPGREAISRAAKLIGIGEVGGPPTEPTEVGSFESATDHIVLATGQTADDVPFEIVAYRSDVPIQGTEDATVCANIEFPGTVDDTQGCYSGALRFGDICCPILQINSPATAVPYVEGQVNPRVDGVSVTYVDTSGRARTVDAVVGEITPAFAARLDVEHPIGIFIASLPDLAVEDLDPGVPGPKGAAETIELRTFGADGQELEGEAIEPLREAVTDAQVRGPEVASALAVAEALRKGRIAEEQNPCSYPRDLRRAIGLGAQECDRLKGALNGQYPRPSE